jgi:hypothetical protein
LRLALSASPGRDSAHNCRRLPATEKPHRNLHSGSTIPGSGFALPSYRLEHSGSDALRMVEKTKPPGVARRRDGIRSNYFCLTVCKVLEPSRGTGVVARFSIGKNTGPATHRKSQLPFVGKAARNGGGHHLSSGECRALPRPAEYPRLEKERGAARTVLHPMQ